MDYLPAICALAGAVIGAAGVGFVTWLTQREETKRRLMTTLIERGMKEWEEHFDIATIRRGKCYLQ